MYHYTWCNVVLSILSISKIVLTVCSYLVIAREEQVCRDVQKEKVPFFILLHESPLICLDLEKNRETFNRYTMEAIVTTYRLRKIMKTRANEHIAKEIGELILSEIQGRPALVIYFHKDKQNPMCNDQFDEMCRKLRI